MSVPYYTGTAGFEYTRGEVTLNGIIYRYVKKRCINDTLEMYCIPHMQKMELLTARDMFVKLSANYLQPVKPTEKVPGKINVKPFVFEGFANSRAAWFRPAAPALRFVPESQIHYLPPFLQLPAIPPENRA
jgi:hypothetical protein